MKNLIMFKTLAIMGSLWVLTVAPALADEPCGTTGCAYVGAQTQCGCDTCSQGCNTCDTCSQGCNSCGTCGQGCGNGCCESKIPLVRWWKRHKARKSECQCDGYCDYNGDGYCDQCDGDCDGCDECDRCKGSCKSRLCKLLCGPFCPRGICGEGAPLFDKYQITYAAQPDYFDQRDGRLYSAQGHGVPMAVPMAPVVRHTYNYGWGMPSSRLTPVSRMIPDSRAPVRR